MRPGRTLAAAAVLLLPGCTHAFFSGIQMPDVTRPVVRIETVGGVEQGASTSEGILFLGRTAREGPCRVHYFVGEVGTPVVESGFVEHWGGVFFEADIGPRVQDARLLERPLREDDELVALVHEGVEVRPVAVRLARGEGIAGDLLEWPGEPLPAGTGLFTPDPHAPGYRFVGMVTGDVTVSDASGERRRLLVFAGTDRVREALATPRLHPEPKAVEFRPDGVIVFR